jgi:hypothetical protein
MLCAPKANDSIRLRAPIERGTPGDRFRHSRPSGGTHMFHLQRCAEPPCERLAARVLEYQHRPVAVAQQFQRPTRYRGGPSAHIHARDGQG